MQEAMKYDIVISQAPLTANELGFVWVSLALLTIGLVGGLISILATEPAIRKSFEDFQVTSNRKKQLKYTKVRKDELLYHLIKA